MKSITFWFDPISPYAYLAFERLPQVLEGCSYLVNYRPVVLGALLQAHQHKGPAEIEPKRAWTFRQVHWLAAQHGIALHTPPQHPFNSLALLRLCVAAGPNRRVVQAVLRHVWCGEADAPADPNDPERLAALTAELAPQRDPQADAVKAELRAHTDAAIAAGVFGVPMFEVDGRAIWGFDALPMLRAAVLEEPWFSGPAWQREGAPRLGLKRV